MPARIPQHAHTRAIWLALSAVYVIWSTTFIAIKVTNETLPPMLAAGLRFLVAGGIMLPIALRFGDRLGDRPGAREWRGAATVALLLMVGGNGGIVWAEKTIPSGVAGLVIATVPLWIAVIDRVVLHRRQPAVVIAGLGLGFAGAVALVGGSAMGGQVDLVGLLVGIGAAASWAIGSVYQRHASLPSRPFVAAGMEMVVAAGAFAVVGLLAGELGSLDPSRFSRASAIALAYLVVFGSWIGFTAYLWLLRNARTSLAATYAYVTPVGAVLLGGLILDEQLSTTTILAGVMIVVAVALIVSGGGVTNGSVSSGAGQERRTQVEAQV